MVIDAPAPDKSITVSVGFNLGSIDKKLFKCDKPFFFQPAHELVIQFVQNFTGQFFVFELIESIPLRFLAFGQPDKARSLSHNSTMRSTARTPRMFA